MEKLEEAVWVVWKLFIAIMSETMHKLASGRAKDNTTAPPTQKPLHLTNFKLCLKKSDSPAL